MKSSFPALFLTFFLLGCNNGTDPDDQCRFETVDILTFSSGGARISKEEIFDADKNLQRYCTFTFNPAGNLTNVTLHDASGAVINYIINTLNVNGDTEKETYLNADSALVGYVLYTFDSNAKVQTSMEYDSANTLTNINRYAYNANGSISEINNYNTDEILLFKQVHSRNETGQLLRVDYISADGTKLAFKTFTYDNRAYTITINFHDCMPLGKRRTVVSKLRFDHQLLMPGVSFR